MKSKCLSEETSGLTETQVGAVHDSPADETAGGCQVDQPTENNVCTIRGGHEGQEREQRLPFHLLSRKFPVTGRRLTQKATETRGSPAFVTRLNILGAWPRMERPNNTREEVYK